MGKAREICTYYYSEPQAYLPLWELQKKWVQEIDQGMRSESFLLLEHTPVYTLGRGAKKEHLLISSAECARQGIDVVPIDRGGDITYHGPGQLVGYPLLRLDPAQLTAHLYLRKLEDILITTLKHFNFSATRNPPYTGVWINQQKIAAIGVKFNRAARSKSFITSHGFALNVNTDLTYFEQIIPCGIREFGVTSMKQLSGQSFEVKEIVQVLTQAFYQAFDAEPGKHVQQ